MYGKVQALECNVIERICGCTSSNIYQLCWTKPITLGPLFIKKNEKKSVPGKCLLCMMKEATDFNSKEAMHLAKFCESRCTNPSPIGTYETKFKIFSCAMVDKRDIVTWNMTGAPFQMNKVLLGINLTYDRANRTSQKLATVCSSEEESGARGCGGGNSITFMVERSSQALWAKTPSL